MKKIALILLCVIGIIVVISSIDNYFTSEDSYRVVYPEYLESTNDSNTWKDYKSNLYSFSYPPQWKVKECKENCIDSASLILQFENDTDRFIQITRSEERIYCDQQLERNQTRSEGGMWDKLTVVVRTIKSKDQKDIYITEGVVKGEAGYSNIYKMFAIVHSGEFCDEFIIHPGEDKDTVEKILTSLTFNN